MLSSVRTLVLSVTLVAASPALAQEMNRIPGRSMNAGILHRALFIAFFPRAA
jgi:hypothetical protein